MQVKLVCWNRSLAYWERGSILAISAKGWSLVKPDWLKLWRGYLLWLKTCKQWQIVVTSSAALWFMHRSFLSLPISCVHALGVGGYGSWPQNVSDLFFISRSCTIHSVTSENWVSEKCPCLRPCCSKQLLFFSADSTDTADTDMSHQFVKDVNQWNGVVLLWPELALLPWRLVWQRQSSSSSLPGIAAAIIWLFTLLIM